MQVHNVDLKRSINQSTLILSFNDQNSKKGVWERKIYEFGFQNHEKSVQAYEFLSYIYRSGKRYTKYMQESPLKNSAVQDVIHNCAIIHTLENNQALHEVTTTNSAFIVRSGSLMLFRCV